MMNCAEFERGLARWLAAERDEARRSTEVTELRRHATSCPRCLGSVDLLDLLELPPDEGDLVDTPPESYWSELQAGVRRRIHAATPAPGPRRFAWAAIAAAAVLAAALGLWVVRGLPVGWESALDSGPFTLNGVPAGELPPAVDELLQRAGPEDALAGLDFLSGFPGMADPVEQDGAAGAGWVVPDIDGMDAEARGALLLWLEEGASLDRGVES